MQSSKTASARTLWHRWLGLPLMVGVVCAGLNTPLRAAGAATVADAAKADNLTALKKLIKERANVNATANDGSTALLWAVYHSNTEMIKELLAAGASVEVANHYGVTPLL